MFQSIKAACGIIGFEKIVSKRNEILRYSKPKWWDAGKHNLIGGQARVANDCFIDVGYKKNEDGTLTVFVYWGAT